ERDKHVSSKSELALIGARPVRNHIAFLYRGAFSNDWLLVDAGVLIGTLELRERINVRVDLSRSSSTRDSVLGSDDNSFRVDRIDYAVSTSDHNRSRILGGDLFHSGAHQRSLRSQQRHRLALHVRTHQRAVSVVVFEERNQRSRNRYQLFRADI